MTTFCEISDAELQGPWQGVEHDPNGERATIAEREIGNREITCIEDDRTVEVHIYENGSSPATSMFSTWQLARADAMTRRARQAIAWAVMQSGLTTSDLVGFGFEQTV